MQIFRPYVDWRRSADVLDDRRLGKQRVECMQVLNVILRKLGWINDGRKGWLNHPIGLLYYNSGKPYVRDIVGFFNACVQEWVNRGFRNSIDLSDISHLLARVEGTEGTPITRIHELEYRRVLLVKDPAHYVRAFPREEVIEVLETEPVFMSGINGWIFKDMARYRRAVKWIVSLIGRNDA
ncbi:MAG: pyrimidine dimer DNA glycosylase [Thaumarchaeota archaeon]|nr:pyrimidine dimer DNA glycosylase [Candidatus Calditenuaceae archaeon]MDW8186648.1 pyrimidine dimer DNA glycosylase/endonuclease V [Nitrososphaerota archaeon]